MQHHPLSDINHPEPGRERQSALETGLVRLESYLDFRYGSNMIDVTLPDGAIIRLVAAADGSVYAQVLGTR